MPEQKKGRLFPVRIDKDSHPRSYPVNIGDVVQCYINFPLTPSSIVEDIEVSLENDKLQKIGVVITSDLRMPGSGQRSAFFYVMDGGSCTVTLRPVIGGAVDKEYLITFLAPEIEPE